MTAPVSVIGRTDEAAVTLLCSFGETITTPAGTVTPSPAGFNLTRADGKRAKNYDTAAPAVRALRKLRVGKGRAA